MTIDDRIREIDQEMPVLDGHLRRWYGMSVPVAVHEQEIERLRQRIMLSDSLLLVVVVLVFAVAVAYLVQ